MICEKFYLIFNEKICVAAVVNSHGKPPWRNLTLGKHPTNPVNISHLATLRWGYVSPASCRSIVSSSLA